MYSKRWTNMYLLIRVIYLLGLHFNNNALVLIFHTSDVKVHTSHSLHKPYSGKYSLRHR